VVSLARARKFGRAWRCSAVNEEGGVGATSEEGRRFFSVRRHRGKLGVLFRRPAVKLRVLEHWS